MGEIEGLKKENESMKSELENKENMNKQLLAEINQLKKKNEELRNMEEKK